MNDKTRVTFYAGVPHRGRFLFFLLEKRVLAGGLTAVVLAGDDAAAEELDAYLWTCRDDGFLPHARAGDGWAGASPILIAADLSVDHNLRADVLVDWSMRAAERPELARTFPRVIDIVEARPESVAAGRLRYKQFRDAGFAVEAHAVDKR